jgi:hypothetical protein
MKASRTVVLRLTVPYGVFRPHTSDEETFQRKPSKKLVLTRRQFYTPNLPISQHLRIPGDGDRQFQAIMIAIPG